MKVLGRYYELSMAQKEEHAKAEKQFKVMRESGKQCHDSNHPYYYHVWTHTLSPEICYRIEPVTKDIITSDIESLK